MTDRQIFGWRIRSAVPLPDLLTWTGDDREPDITVTVGPVPPLKPPARTFSPAVQIGDHVVRVAIPAVAAYRVEAGRLVTIETSLPLTAPGIRIFLLSTVLAVLCFQRGRLPLHASVVEVDGRALVLSGDSGAGKSTLAATLVRRGFRLLSDDLCLLDTSIASGPLILPSWPRLRLWKQASEHLGIDTAGLEQSRLGIEKHQVPVSAADFRVNVLPPAFVVCLRFVDNLQPLSLTRLGKGEAMRHYLLIHRWQLGLALGQQPLYFTALAALVQSCPVVTLSRPRQFGTLDETANRLLAVVRGEEMSDEAHP